MGKLSTIADVRVLKLSKMLDGRGNLIFTEEEFHTPCIETLLLHVVYFREMKY